MHKNPFLAQDMRKHVFPTLLLERKISFDTTEYGFQPTPEPEECDSKESKKDDRQEVFSKKTQYDNFLVSTNRTSRASDNASVNDAKMSHSGK